MQRSSKEIKARCACILSSKSIVTLVEASSSPSAAYEMVFAESKDILMAKASRWLAVLRRNYPTEYRRLVPAQLGHVSNDTVQTEKETRL